MIKLFEITGKVLSGEWGSEDTTGSGTPVLRTTNFTNTGDVNYTNVVTRNITKRNIEEKYLCPGDIIIEKSGGSDKQPVGRVVYFEGPKQTYLFNNFTGVLRVRDRETWNPKYIFYFLYWNYLMGGTRRFENKTTGLHNLKTDDYVKSISIPKVSRDKQNEICTSLDSIRRIIELRLHQKDLLDTLVKARFVELTTDAECHPVRMGDLATYVNGYAFKPTDWQTSGKPIIRIQNLNNETAPYNYFDGNISSKYAVHSGDVLVSWATHLEAYVWKGPDAWLNQHIFKVLFDKMAVDKTYFVFATEEALREAFRNAHGFKPTMEHIKRSDFENAVVQLPSIITQKNFAAFSEQIDKSKVVVQKALDEAQLLFDSLMQKYFG